MLPVSKVTNLAARFWTFPVLPGGHECEGPKLSFYFPRPAAPVLYNIWGTRIQISPQESEVKPFIGGWVGVIRPYCTSSLFVILVIIGTFLCLCFSSLSLFTFYVYAFLMKSLFVKYRDLKFIYSTLFHRLIRVGSKHKVSFIYSFYDYFQFQFLESMYKS